MDVDDDDNEDTNDDMKEKDADVFHRPDLADQQVNARPSQQWPDADTTAALVRFVRASIYVFGAICAGGLNTL